MSETTQNHRATPIATAELYARVTVLTLSGFMDTLRLARLSAVKTRENMSPQTAPLVFTEPTNGSL